MQKEKDNIIKTDDTVDSSENSTNKQTIDVEKTSNKSGEPIDSDAPLSTKKKKKNKRSVPVGQVHVLATFNNTIVTITDPKGGVITSSSSGECGFRGSKKGTAYAAQVASEKAIEAAKQQFGLSKASVFIKGIGLGRESAVRALASAGIAVDLIQDVTSVPHGGVRPRKARRV